MPGFAAPRPLWLRSPKTDSRPSDQLGRDGMIDAGLVGGDARITIRRESPNISTRSRRACGTALRGCTTSSSQAT